jgi:hypothetical protein
MFQPWSGSSSDALLLLLLLQYCYCNAVTAMLLLQCCYCNAVTAMLLLQCCYCNAVLCNSIRNVILCIWVCRANVKNMFFRTTTGDLKFKKIFWIYISSKHINNAYWVQVLNTICVFPKTLMSRRVSNPSLLYLSRMRCQGQVILNL